MSFFGTRPGYSTSTEAALLTALMNLAAGGAGTAIQKTTATTFSNVSITSGGGSLTPGTYTNATIVVDATGAIISVSSGSGGGGSGTVTSVASADGSVTVTNGTTTADLAVVKAPKLTTARTIGGVSFDGTAAITVASATGGFTVSGGNLTVSAINIVTDTSTGTTIGTATTQKLGFFGATPIVQVGATIDLGVVLSNLGLRASGTAYPITTSGAVQFTGGVTITTTDVTLTDKNIILGTTTGTKFGTGTTQKIGFYNATPIVQPTGDVITALQNLGLVASATVLATTITSRTLWGQTYDGSGNVSGSLTAVGNITGGASSMTITAGTGNSRTLALQSTTSGGAATTFLTGDASQNVTLAGNLTLGASTSTITGAAGNMTIVAGTGNSRTLILQTTTSGGTATTAVTLNADQTTTFAAGISGTGAWTVTGGAGNMTIVSGTGNSRTMILQTTTSGGSATTALTLNADQSATFAGTVTSLQSINTDNAIAASGNAATVPVTSRHNKVTNNSAATLTITLATSGAVAGQMVVVRILDFSAVAQTITWVNTENSTVTAPTTSNGSTTLPLTVGFQYNSATSLWRCLASA